MVDSLEIPAILNKTDKYQALLPQIEALIDNDVSIIANLSNVIAALKYSMGYWWVGIYFAEKGKLMLGPFQGPIACTTIGFDKGVCGKCWKEKATIIVDNVDEFPGHIACSSETKSEIVIPAFNKKGDVSLVLDIDSENLSDFDEIDQQYLEKVVKIIERLID